MTPDRRSDEPLPDHTTVVIHGGVMRPEDMRRNALTTLRQHGFLGVSVFAAVNMTLEQLLSGPVYVPHARIRTATVGSLNDAGYELRRTLKLPYHFDMCWTMSPTTLWPGC